jgi:hypothetical protein
MREEKGECPCSEQPIGDENPVKELLKISPETLERLRSAVIPVEFFETARELTPRPEVPPAIVPQDSATAAQIEEPYIAGPIPERLDEPELEAPSEPWPQDFSEPEYQRPMEPEVPTEPPEVVRGGEGASPLFLTDLRLDLSGVAHMTPGLLELADIALGQLIFQMQGSEDGGAILFQRDDDGEDDDTNIVGGTVVDEPLEKDNGNCAVAVFARVVMKREDDARAVETYNLAAGFEEIVVPFGYVAFPFVQPDASRTRPYPGTLTVKWEIVDPDEKRVLFEGTVSGGSDALDKVKRLKNTVKDGRKLSYPKQSLPISRKHKITYEWTSDTGVTCAGTKKFTVTFAEAIGNPPNLDLGDFYTRRGGFSGFREQRTEGTRVFDTGPIQFRDSGILVPLVIYWEVVNCCGLRTKAEVIQFARAVITGPNGHQAKEWTLDILPRNRRNRKPPNHDPTFTNVPYDDRDESPAVGSRAGGGTRAEGTGLGQWDAPGMPKRLYDQLAAAQTGRSEFRQQFLSLLVCRPSGTHRAQDYLKTGKIRRVLIYTVTWTFDGKGAEPTVRVSSRRTLDLGSECFSLERFLRTNELLERFNNPTEEARGVKILPQDDYDRVKEDVDEWERDPLAQIRLS